MASNHAEVPDPELDDLLDGVLDDLAAAPTAATTTSGTKAAQPVSTQADDANANGRRESVEIPPIDDYALDQEFAKELAAGMEELMNSSEYNNDEFKDAMGAILNSLGSLNVDEHASAASSGEQPAQLDANAKSQTAATPSASSAKKPKSAAASANAGGNFQDKIKETMARMQNSSEQVGSELKDESPDALVAEMMKQMEQLTDSNEFEGMLENMMESLMSREILYDPLKDLAAKYPEYLERTKDTLPADEHKKYAQQFEYVKQIMAIYDRTAPGAEESPEESRAIIDLMTKMQELGQPPAEIMKDLAPDMEVDPQTGIPRFPDFSGGAGGEAMNPEDCKVM
ncbi:Peroxisome chaperone and import receptor [Sorochytrium milnesiophthora]